MKDSSTGNPSFDDMLTLYGRKPVLEALQNDEVEIFRLHVARGTNRSPIVNEILELAEARAVEVHYHSRLELSRISGNSRQDQGIAIDIIAPGYAHLNEFVARDRDLEVLALEGITNPQNLGMIVRSVAASPLAGLVLPKRGCARLDGLVIKASAGTLLGSRIYHCETLVDGLDQLVEQGFEVIGLASAGETDIADVRGPGRRVLVLGNESQGLSPDVMSRCHRKARIPLGNRVDSLNVSAAAAIVAFRSLFERE